MGVIDLRRKLSVTEIVTRELLSTVFSFILSPPSPGLKVNFLKTEALRKVRSVVGSTCRPF